MIISLVVASADNNAIGKNNKLLWHLPNDMRFFKNLTWGMAVIMGRKTFESLGKPLSGRKNIVITRQPNWKVDGVLTVSNLDDALFAISSMDMKEAFIIGGGEVYALSLPKANRIYLTRVHAKPEADAFFPVLNQKEWQLASKKDFPVDNKHAYAYSFELWERK